MAAVSSVHNPSLNMRNPSVKRIMKEYQQFQEDPSDDFVAAPLEDNMFEWHFTIKGPPDSEFTGGLYHGRIILPDQYPFKPPDIMILTPNGRFETNTKICLSVTGFHPKSWQPSWGIRTVLLALSAFFPTEAKGAVGSLEFPKADRQRLAAKSPAWKCDVCSKCNSEFFTSEALARPAVAVTSVSTPPQDSPAVGPSSAPSPFSVPATPPFPAVPSPQLDAATPRAEGLRQRGVPASPGLAPQSVQTRPAAATQTTRASRNDRLLNVLTMLVAFLVVVLLARKFTRNGNSLAYALNASSE